VGLIAIPLAPLIKGVIVIAALAVILCAAIYSLSFSAPTWRSGGDLTMSEVSDPPSETPDCCEVWPKILHVFNWMRYDAWPSLCSMPHFRVGKDAWRVNHCPSCGADRRNANARRARIELAQENSIV
jgi:hypothetical protein